MTKHFSGPIIVNYRHFEVFSILSEIRRIWWCENYCRGCFIHVM